MLTNLYLVRHAHSTYTPEELKDPYQKRTKRCLQSQRVTKRRKH